MWSDQYANPVKPAPAVVAPKIGKRPRDKPNIKISIKDVQKLGIEYRNSPANEAILSKIEYCLTAAVTPRKIAIIIDKN